MRWTEPAAGVAAAAPRGCRLSGRPCPLRLIRPDQLPLSGVALGQREAVEDEQVLAITVLGRLGPFEAGGRYPPPEQTHRRHGIATTLAGLDVRTGQVTLVVRRRRRHQGFLERLQAIRRRWPRSRLIIVADNLSVHAHPAVRARVATQQGQVPLVFLPLHASWLNQNELWFSVLERQCRKRTRRRTEP